MTQKKREPSPKVYALHAPEVECIAKGKPHKPYEFGVKVSVAATLKRCKGVQFAIHAKALAGRPYDGHTLKDVIPEIESLTGATLKRILVDAGYRGHNAPGVYKLRVFTAGQKRRVTPILAAAGRNFRLILKWIRLLLSPIRMWVSENHQRRSVQIAA